MKPGKYKAELLDAGLSPDKNGDPQPYMKFNVVHGDEAQVMTWFGNRKSEKSEELAIKALVAAGFVGNDWEDLKAGVNPLTFAVPQNLMVELENHTYQGKTELRIKWVNSGGLKKFEGQAPKAAAKFSAAKAKAGVKSKAAGW